MSLCIFSVFLLDIIILVSENGVQKNLKTIITFISIFLIIDVINNNCNPGNIFPTVLHWNQMQY